MTLLQETKACQHVRSCKVSPVGEYQDREKTMCLDCDILLADNPIIEEDKPIPFVSLHCPPKL